MPRPSSADLLAFQLEQAAADKAGRASPLPLSAPPSSSFGATPQFAPSTPATPWLDDIATPRASELPVDLAISEPSRGKLQSRSGTRPVQDEDEEVTDNELEDELNDFGYGAPKRRKEKKESLLDILNSDPPDWLAQTPSTAKIDPEPLLPAQPKRSVTLSKLRQRFGSTGPTSEAPSLPASDSYSGLSTLRTSRSASNLLTSLRGRLGGGTNGINRSRDDLSEASSVPGNASQSSLPYANGHDLAAFDRLAPVPVRKLAAKDASTTSSSTRDLADFLRSSGPPELPMAEFGALPSLPASLSVGTKPSARLHKQRPSVSTAAKGRSSRSAHTAPSSEAGSFDASASVTSGRTAIIKAAMVKLGAGGRRASLTPLAKQGVWPGSVAGHGDRQCSGSSDDAGSGTIRVDDELLTGMFGRSRPSAPPQQAYAPQDHRRRASADAASVMDIAEFVTTDELRARHFEQSLLPVETLAGDLAERAVAGLGRSTSQRSNGSLNQFSPPRVASPQRIARKPVPASIPPIEELLSSSPPSRSSPFVKQKTLEALQQLQDRSDTSPLVADESPIRGSEVLAHYGTLAPISPVSPLTPSTVYGTPPVTPTPNALEHAHQAPPRNRTATSDSTLSISAQSKRLSLIAAATARPASPAPDAPLPLPPVRGRTSSLQRPTGKAEAIGAVELGAGHAGQAERSAPAPALMGAFAAPPAPVATLSIATRALSLDSPLDPPFTAGKPPIITGGGDAALLAALAALQDCLRTAASYPASLGSVVGPAVEREELVQAVVPVLSGLSEQMRRGARLVEEVLTRLEVRPAGDAEELEGEMGRAAEAVLIGV